MRFWSTLALIFILVFYLGTMGVLYYQNKDLQKQVQTLQEESEKIEKEKKDLKEETKTYLSLWNLLFNYSQDKNTLEEEEMLIKKINNEKLNQLWEEFKNQTDKEKQTKTRIELLQQILTILENKVSI